MRVWEQKNIREKKKFEIELKTSRFFFIMGCTVSTSFANPKAVKVLSSRVSKEETLLNPPDPPAAEGEHYLAASSIEEEDVAA